MGKTFADVVAHRDASVNGKYPQRAGHPTGESIHGTYSGGTRNSHLSRAFSGHHKVMLTMDGVVSRRSSLTEFQSNNLMNWKQ